MSNFSKHMIGAMNKIMLDCDTATLYVTKRDYVKLGCVNSIKLRMHLMGCKFCRKYAQQSLTISHHISQLSIVEKDNLRHQLSNDQKNSIVKKLEKQIVGE